VASSKPVSLSRRDFPEAKLGAGPMLSDLGLLLSGRAWEKSQKNERRAQVRRLLRRNPSRRKEPNIWFYSAVISLIYSIWRIASQLALNVKKKIYKYCIYGKFYMFLLGFIVIKTILYCLLLCWAAFSRAKSDCVRCSAPGLERSFCS